MEHLLSELGEHLIFAIVGVVFVIGMALRAVTTMVTAGSRERTRREIAAYIAEGSMSPEQGERLLRAGPANRGSACC